MGLHLFKLAEFQTVESDFKIALERRIDEAAKVVYPSGQLQPEHHPQGRLPAGPGQCPLPHITMRNAPRFAWKFATHHASRGNEEGEGGQAASEQGLRLLHLSAAPKLIFIFLFD